MTKPLPVSGTDDSLPAKSTASTQEPSAPPRRKAPRRATSPAGTPVKKAPQPLIMVGSTPAAPDTDDAGSAPTLAPAPSAGNGTGETLPPANSADDAATGPVDAEAAAEPGILPTDAEAAPGVEASSPAMDPQADESVPDNREDTGSSIAEETTATGGSDTISVQEAATGVPSSAENDGTPDNHPGSEALAAEEQPALIDSADVPMAKSAHAAGTAPQKTGPVADPETADEAPAAGEIFAAAASDNAEEIVSASVETPDTISAQPSPLARAEEETDSAAADSEAEVPEEGEGPTETEAAPDAPEPVDVPEEVLAAVEPDAADVPEPVEPAPVAEAAQPAESEVPTDSPAPAEAALDSESAETAQPFDTDNAPEALEADNVPEDDTTAVEAEPAEDAKAAQPDDDFEGASSSDDSGPAEPAVVIEAAEPAETDNVPDAPEPEDAPADATSAIEPELASTAEAADSLESAGGPQEFESAVAVQPSDTGNVAEAFELEGVSEDATAVVEAGLGDTAGTVELADAVEAAEPVAAAALQPADVPGHAAPAVDAVRADDAEAGYGDAAGDHEGFDLSGDAFDDEPPFNFDLLTRPEPEAPAPAPNDADEAVTGAAAAKFDVSAFLKPDAADAASPDTTADGVAGAVRESDTFVWPSPDLDTATNALPISPAKEPGDWEDPEAAAPAPKTAQSNVARALAAWTAESEAESAAEHTVDPVESGGEAAKSSRRSRRRAQGKESAVAAPEEVDADMQDVEPEAVADEEPAPAKKQKKDKKEKQEREPRKKKRTLLILAAIVVVVLALGAVLYTISNDNAATEQTEKDRQAAWAATNALLDQVNELSAVSQDPAVMDQLSQTAIDLSAQSKALDDGMPKGTFSAISSGATSAAPTLSPATLPGVVAALQKNGDAMLGDAYYASKAMGRVFASAGTSQLMRSQSLAAAANIQLPASDMLAETAGFQLATGPECKSTKTPREGVTLDGALRAAAEGEQKAIYAYQVASAHLGGDEGLRGRTLTAKHQDKLVALNAELAARCLPTVTLIPAYALSPEFTSAPGAALAGLENELAATYADLAALSEAMPAPVVATTAPAEPGATSNGETTSPTPTSKAGVTSELREISVAWLLDTTRTHASWGGTVAALPGITAAQ
ncbi:cytoskeletal protein RodZ [Arthrobacter stackebrandtii]|uniref:Cytoskeletal protein RodZ n=1 Tax=Arthrobacter stackebrandtii TaxID=272161 RepID=A0ABS4YS45_9MICC|nr:cytoskeletal protein RodZ [Arthrobacter stackebrandtii]